MSVLDRVLTYSDATSRGVFRYITEAELRQATKGANSLTVREVLRLPLNVKLLTYFLMHEEYVAPNVMRRIAATIASEVLAILAKRQTYIDFRTLRAVDCARSLALGKCSVGELMLARMKAEAARDDVMELGDETVDRAAAIALSVCDPDSRAAIQRTVGDALEIFQDEPLPLAVIEILERELRDENS